MSHHYTIQNKLCTVLETYIWYSSRRTYIWSKEVRERNFRVGIAREQKKRDDNIRERPGEEKRRRGEEERGEEARGEEERRDERRWEEMREWIRETRKGEKRNNRGEDKRCEKRQEERRREERGEERGARSGGEQRRGGEGRGEEMRRERWRYEEKSCLHNKHVLYDPHLVHPGESCPWLCYFLVLTFLKLKSWCPSQTNEACRH